MNNSRILAVTLMLSLVGNIVCLSLLTREGKTAPLSIPSEEALPKQRSHNGPANDLVGDSPSEAQVSAEKNVAVVNLVREYSKRLAHSRSGAKLEYWKNDRPYGEDLKTKLDRLDIRRDFEKQMLSLLGDDYEPDVPLAFKFLSKAKQIDAYYLNEEFNAYQGEIRRNNPIHVLPKEKEMLDALSNSRMEELASILSPDELLGLRLRISKESSVLHSRLNAANVSEEEFKSIFVAADAAKLLVYGDFSTSAQDSASRARKLNDIVTSIVSEDTRPALQREMDLDYSQLHDLANRLGVTQDRLEPIYELRTRVEGILGNESLDLAGKRQALSGLSEQANALVLATLGSDGFAAYKQTSIWMRAMEIIENPPKAKAAPSG